jgi:hypothetical protein
MIEVHQAVNGEKWLLVNGNWIQVTNNIKLVEEIKELTIENSKGYVVNMYTDTRTIEPYISIGFSTEKDAKEFKHNLMGLIFSDLKKPTEKKKPAVTQTIMAESTPAKPKAKKRGRNRVKG